MCQQLNLWRERDGYALYGGTNRQSQLGLSTRVEQRIIVLSRSTVREEKRKVHRGAFSMDKRCFFRDNEY